MTNDTVPGGTLKICESADPKAPAGAALTFAVSSPTPTGSTTNATVPFGSCTIVPSPVTMDDPWLYNSTVTITQTASPFPVVSIGVSPTARNLGTSGATLQVAIGSGDTTIATYTNDPPGSPGAPGAPVAGSPGSVNIGGSTVIAAVSGTTGGSGSTAAGGSAGAAAHTQLRFARLVKSHGHVYLVVRVEPSGNSAKIRIVELNKRGQKVRAFMATIATNRNVKLAIPLNNQVRVADVKLA